VGSHEEDSIQGSLEKSASISKIIFNAPPTALTYLYVIAASAFFGLFLTPTPTGALVGLVLIGVPALIAGPLSAPLASLLGGTLYYKRAAFLAAVSATIVGAVLVLSVPVRTFFDVPIAHVVLLGYMMATSTRHAVLWATSDNRHLRTLPVSFLQLLAATLLMGYALPYLGGGPLGAREFLIAFLLAIIFLGPLIFFLHIFDTPLKKSFQVSGSELFRYYLDHLTSGRVDGEAILGRFAEPIRAKFGVIGFRRSSDNSLKAAIVVPALHPGPIGKLGGSDLPAKVAEAIPDCDLVMVPHGSATHDYNPVSTADVERFGRAAAKLLSDVPYEEGGSRAVTAGEDIRVTAQSFGGNTALLTYTSWPLPIDDVEYGVGLAAESAARIGGAKRAFFVDCHNSLLPGAGQVAL
jgi:putative membrane protein